MLSKNGLGKFIAAAILTVATMATVTAAETQPAKSPGKIIVLKAEG